MGTALYLTEWDQTPFGESDPILLLYSLLAWRHARYATMHALLRKPWFCFAERVLASLGFRATLPCSARGPACTCLTAFLTR